MSTSVRACRTPAGCRYRLPVSADGPAGAARCALLDRIFGLPLEAESRVSLEVCESCCEDPEPSVEQFNPTVASLVYGIAEGLQRRAGLWHGRALDVLKAADRAAAQAGETNVNEFGLRFVRPPEMSVGHGIHRSGWPLVRSWLASVDPGQPVLLDDFVEQSCGFKSDGRPHAEPWIGFFHYPPATPEFAGRHNQLQWLFERPQWIESARWLRGAICLSEYLAEYLRGSLDVPVEVVRHPIGPAVREWSIEEFRSGPAKRLVQLGGFLRNTRAIFQVPRIEGFQKTRVMLRMDWLIDYDAAVADYWNHHGRRVEYGGVDDVGYVSLVRYDRILAGSVVLTELFDASANNVVLECIAAATPLVVNRHPATEEYLGEQYPLFFDEIDEVPGLLSDANIAAAHKYLRSMDRSWLSGDAFVQSCQAAIRRILAVDAALPRPPSSAGNSSNPAAGNRAEPLPTESLLKRSCAPPSTVSSEAAPADCIHRTDRLLRVLTDVPSPGERLRVFDCELHGPCAPAAAPLPAGVEAVGCLDCRDYAATRMPRIALITPYWKVGGSERWFLALLRNLKRVQCMGIALTSGAASVDEVVEEARRHCRVTGTRVLSRECNSNRVERYRDAETAIRAVTQNADIVLAWGVESLGRLREWFDEKIVALVSHGTDAWTTRFLAASAPAADRLVAVSDAARQTFPAELHDRVRVIRNGVETDRICPTRTRTQTREAWGVSDNESVVGFIGRFDENKRPELVARAAARIDGTAAFRVVGHRDPVIEERVRAIAGDRCAFVDGGSLGDFYAAVDCIMQPSRSEGLSMVGLEAWAAGCPLISTPVGGIAELEREFGPLALTIPLAPTDDDLAEAVRAAASPEFQPTVSNARKLVWEQFTAARMTRDWEDYFVELLRAESR